MMFASEMSAAFFLLRRAFLGVGDLVVVEMVVMLALKSLFSGVTQRLSSPPSSSSMVGRDSLRAFNMAAMFTSGRWGS